MVNGVAVDTSPGQICTDGATLIFCPLATSDTGKYTCTLTVSVSQPEQSKVQNIIIHSKYDCLMYMYIKVSLSPTVPQPGVDITLSHAAPLYAGTDFTLTCTVTLDTNVDNGEMIVTEWSGPQDIQEERYSVTGASGSGSTYTDTLTISPLAHKDDGIYVCYKMVTGRSNVYPATASAAVNVTVLGKRMHVSLCEFIVDRAPILQPSLLQRSCLFQESPQ